ncbi:MAG: c-type cytochrome [Bacteroidota bacterium]
MKKIGMISASVAMMLLAVSCNKVRRSPGRTYMPDMAYSRAHETYSSTGDLQKSGASYNAMPVAGTMARGDMAWHYPYANDSAGYANSKNVVNPLPELDAKQFMEAARLYLVNCGICHGEKLDGNGPLWKDGNGPFPAAPKNLMGDDIKAMAEGTMFHSVTFGKGQMGSYASQLSTEQRWMVIHYIKEKQAASGNKAAAQPAADSAAVTPK